MTTLFFRLSFFPFFFLASIWPWTTSELVHQAFPLGSGCVRAFTYLSRSATEQLSLKSIKLKVYTDR